MIAPIAGWPFLSARIVCTEPKAIRRKNIFLSAHFAGDVPDFIVTGPIALKTNPITESLGLADVQIYSARIGAMDICQTLELWGGIECTINRVGDHFHDQLKKNGHEQRGDDVDLLCSLGIKAIRYPVLWERYCRQTGDAPDFSRTKRIIARFQERGVETILGLLHHGSGPIDTSLVDHQFPEKFADYALEVAKQFPHVHHFTPINEPLTTARFSGLYGHWYPHHRNDKSFLLALFHQLEATRLAMQAIRSINPAAKLVQTENIEQCHSTRALRYQAEFENARRWLSIDLLTGRFDHQHPLWNYVEHHLDEPDLIDRLVDHPVGIDILGWNYYLTSERFLDHRLERYSNHTHGGNGRDRYADVEAVRVLTQGVEGLEGLVMQAWNRYQLPTAITEVHLGCHRESQMRWLLDAWQAVLRLRNAGVDLRAMTAWSLLGCFDWDSLCTLPRSHYEPGAFDIRSGRLRPTCLAALIRNLSGASDFDHPALPAQGWWDLPGRLIFGADEDDPTWAGLEEPSRTQCDLNVRGLVKPDIKADRPPLLITGGDGKLARVFSRFCTERGLAHQLMTRKELDITKIAAIEKAIQKTEPWAIINTAGYVRIDAAENARSECFRANAAGARRLAKACAKYQIPLVTFSSDLVFDGAQHRPYVESDLPRALNIYGESKLLAENAVLRFSSRSLVIRTSSFFAPWDDCNFLTRSLQILERGEKVRAVNDWQISPTYLSHLVHTCLDLLIDGATGIWHVTNSGQTSWYNLLCEVGSMLGLNTDNIIGQSVAEFGYIAQRPRYSALTSHHGALLPPLADSIEQFCMQWQSVTSRSLQLA
jgi:dTDP-4-dehydrorhamnose reductase